MADAIVPRWEWRTFGDRFGAGDRRFDGLTPEAVRETDEVYVLSRLTDSSVKLRDQLIDVKVLREVSDDGLERWEPVLKAPAVLPPDDFHVLADGLGLEVLAVRVHKRRAPYLLGGCLAGRPEVPTQAGPRAAIRNGAREPAPGR